MMQVNKWQNCYDDGWQGVIVLEAFAHPAKMSYGLLKRILAHAQEQGWLNGVILDPFGGIGSTGILGAYEGYQVVCCELEQKFVDLAEQNFKLHDNAWQKFGNPRPVIIQGDSRRLCEVVEKADCVIGSPPFAVRQPPAQIEFEKLSKTQKDDYGQTPGQLGAMKPGKVDMVMSSPPYVDAVKTGEGPGAKVWSEEKGHWIAADYTQGKYGVAQGNLGNLKSGDVDCVLGSPPYEGSIQTDGDGIDWSKIKEGGTNKTLAREAVGTGYGKAKGQLAEERGDTFWSAAKIIVEQCFKILKPSGHAIWVVKSFVRNKRIVDFPSDWQRLCESVGFKTVCVHHAMLVKEMSHKTLFGYTEVKRKERKSFFRRLAESKGSPRIDFEVVLCMEAPK